MPWARLWQDIGQRVDAQKPGRVTLTIDEIRSTTGTEQNIDKPWWWRWRVMKRSPATTSDCARAG